MNFMIRVLLCFLSGFILNGERGTVVFVFGDEGEWSIVHVIKMYSSVHE